MTKSVSRKNRAIRRLSAVFLANMILAASPPPRPIDAGILFLPQDQRDIRFAHMERYYTGHWVRAGRRITRLRIGRPLPLAEHSVDVFMSATHVAGLIVLQHGRARLIRYAPGIDPKHRWTSFSVAKSITSTLVGAAIRDRYIHSIDDPVTRYLPALTGSAYDGVTIAQMMAMRSGVRWTEDYADPDADVVKLYRSVPAQGEERTIAYMRKLQRAEAPGKQWTYNTGETDLTGELVRAATGQSLAAYMSRTIWKRSGMASDAYWLTDAQGHEAGGSGLSMTLDDMARFGQLALKGGLDIVPPGWFPTVTTARSGIGGSNGYGMLWWTFADQRFAARGIFGQSILVDPKTDVVIAMIADWPRATSPALVGARAHFEDQVIAAARF